MRECPNGHPVEEGHRFCPQCGEAVVGGDDHADPSRMDASESRRRLALAGAGLLIVAVVVGFIVLTNRTSNSPRAKANFVQSEEAIQALDRCEQNLSDWTIFISNYPAGVADVAATFGVDSPIAVWLKSESASFKALAATEGQTTAQGVLGTQAVPKCVSLRSGGTPVGSIPEPPASPKSPPPPFEGRIPAAG